MFRAASINLLREISDTFPWWRPIRFKSRELPRIDKSKVPELNERDLEEQYVSGSGPGGQSVNKAVNCCILKHLPTGLVVKVHQSRDLQQNREIARELLVTKLDNLLNGEDSVESQKRKIALKKLARRDAQRERLRNLKEEYKEILERDKQHSGSKEHEPDPQ